MSNELEIQQAAIAAADLQVRNATKDEIKKIFAQILQANSALRQYVTGQGLSFREFESMFKEYQEALFVEVDFLPFANFTEKSNHPLLAAVALSNINVSQSTQAFSVNLGNFRKEVNDSHFYPRTKAVALAIVIGLTLAVVTALMLMIILPASVSFNFIGCLSAAVGLYMAGESLNTSNARFRPVYAAMETGNRVAGFFSNKPKPQLAEAKFEKTGLARAVSVDSRLGQEERRDAVVTEQRPPAYEPPTPPYELSEVI